MDPTLDAVTIARRLAAHPAWQGDAQGLHTRLSFDSFGGAMRFMAACVDGIEQRDHHPLWSNSERVVELRVATLNRGPRVTERDFELVAFFDDVLRQHGARFGHQPGSAG